MDALTARILKQGRIASSGTSKTPLSLAVTDQLIVQVGQGQSILGGVESYLQSKKIKTQRLGHTVFDGLPGGGGDTDFQVLELQSPQGSADIFQHADELRANVGVLKGNPGAVSPNHILVPAPNSAGCPYGAPSEAPDVSVAPATGLSPVVTVIDSGYQWDLAHWGANPLQDPGLCSITTNFSDRLQGTATLATVAPGSAAGWLPGVAEAPALSGNAAVGKLLFALAGHANFVAGVIALGCHQPTIHIWSHSSTYVRNTDYFTTEAAVCRSLAMSQQPPPLGTGPTDVIHVGFAFPLRSGKFSFRFARDFLSLAWTTAFQSIEATFAAAGKPNPPVVVAPAGNENEPFRHYPAALAREFAGTPLAALFANVKGVGSITPPPITSPDPRSTFSNYGDWVTCSAVGENVQSTFLRVKNVLCEADSPRTLKSFADAWATWSGTSFAAPKVAAAVAAYVAASAGSATPAQAWDALRLVHGHPVPHPGSGILFTDL